MKGGTDDPAETPAGRARGGSPGARRVHGRGRSGLRSRERGSTGERRAGGGGRLPGGTAGRADARDRAGARGLHADGRGLALHRHLAGGARARGRRAFGLRSGAGDGPRRVRQPAQLRPRRLGHPPHGGGGWDADRDHAPRGPRDGPRHVGATDAHGGGERVFGRSRFRDRTPSPRSTRSGGSSTCGATTSRANRSGRSSPRPSRWDTTRGPTSASRRCSSSEIHPRFRSGMR